MEYLKKYTQLIFTVFLLMGFTQKVLADWAPELPEKLKLNVCETQGISRQAEVVNSGLPIPKALNIYDISALSIVDDKQKPVNASFRSLGRWHGAGSDKPIKWVTVNFKADMGANSCRAYYLSTAGQDQKQQLQKQVQLVKGSEHWLVKTGVASFSIGTSPGPLFSQIINAEGQQLLKGSATKLQIEGRESRPFKLRNLEVESQTEHLLVIRVEQVFDVPAKGATQTQGTGLVTGITRYEFRAGSATAIVRYSLNWEGNHCIPGSFSGGFKCTNGEMNARLLQGIRHSFSLSDGLGQQLVIGAEKAKALQSFDYQRGVEVKLEQKLRQKHSQAVSYELSVDKVVSTGQKADGALLALGGARGGLAIALKHMHRYEPQALTLTADGQLNIDMLSDNTWLGIYQGLYASMSVTAISNNPELAQLRSDNWALLNHPLRAWPEAQWFAASGAVDEFPYRNLAPEVARYDEYMAKVMDTTLTQIDSAGLAGISTFGLYPRYWGLYGSHELACSGNDPTPEMSWDDKYWCGTWTDYHNTTMAVPNWAMRTGQVKWLDELSEPAAQRMLHTQIFQCAPGDPFFRCGQSPSGYGAYRFDANSSHAYFDNLIMYYWLTGDETVTRTLRRGADNMRRYICPQRNKQPLGNVCQATDPTTSRVTGRVVSQWLQVYKFLGESVDSSFLDDWKSTTARWLTQHYAHVRSDTGKQLGFTKAPSADGIEGQGPFSSQQVWMLSLYDYQMLHQLQDLTGDQVVAGAELKPSEVITAWANTLVHFSKLYAGPEGKWPNKFSFGFSGSKIGGQLGELQSRCPTQDCLYNSNKATFPALLQRVADSTQDVEIKQLADAMTTNAIRYGLDYELQPLNKISAFYLSRLHAAVARISERHVDTEVIVDAGSDQELQLPKTQIKLNGYITPGHAALWQQLHGPAQANIAAPERLDTLVNFEVAGRYVFELKAKSSDQRDQLVVNVLAEVGDGLPKHQAGDDEYYLGFWNNDDSPKAGYVDLLVYDKLRHCGDGSARSQLAVYLKAVGDSQYRVVNPEFWHATASCGAGDYSDNTKLTVQLPQAGEYQLVTCFSGSDTMCTSAVVVRSVARQVTGLPVGHGYSAYHLSHWLNDTSAKAGYVEVLIDDLKRTCGAVDGRNLLSFYLKVQRNTHYVNMA